MPGLLDALRDPQFLLGLLDNTRQVGGGLLAGTVGAPVDIMTMLMRPFGYKTPDKQVVGSSEHLAGLLGLNTDSVPYKVGSLLPNDPSDLMKYGGLLGHMAYHGSPHKFDKFQMDKIGTGEGAQAYGHGLYFAENPGVAKSYSSMDHPAIGRDPRDEVTALRQNWQTNPSPRTLSEDEVKYLMQDFESLKPHQSNPDIVRNIARAVNGHEPGGTVSTEALYALRALDKQLPPKPSGSFYKVDIADAAIPKMLDWDKPLSQQPGAVEAFKVAREKAGMKNDYWQPGKIATGAMEYQKLESVVGKAQASQLLREAGIPGIRYKDGASRGNDAGTSNFVLFDDSLVKILERQ